MTKTKKSLSIILSFIIMLSSMLGIKISANAASYKTVSGNMNYSYASQVLELVNKERSVYGLKPLTMTESLTDGAMLRAAETVVSFSHTRPNGEQCFTAFNWTRAAGENIAYGQRSPSQVMNSWMNSSGHRANILNSNFTTIGVGCFEYNGVLYWAQAFSGGSGNSYSPAGTKKATVNVSLTSGVKSEIYFGETAANETTASEPSTKPSTTKPSVTKPSTTSPSTSRPSTTKESTTMEATTDHSTTKEAEANQPTTVKEPTTKIVVETTKPCTENNGCGSIKNNCNADNKACITIIKYLNNCSPCSKAKCYFICSANKTCNNWNMLMKCDKK